MASVAGSVGLAVGGNGAASEINLPVEVSAVAGQSKTPGAGPGVWSEVPLGSE